MRRLTLHLDPAVLEALEETAEALHLGKSKLIELVVSDWLERYEIPPERAPLAALPPPKETP